MTTNKNLCAPCLAVLQAVSMRPSRPAIQWKKNSGGWIPAKESMMTKKGQERREREIFERERDTDREKERQTEKERKRLKE